MAPSHREKTVGKQATNAGSPPRDSKIEGRKRCVAHPGFIDGPPRGQHSRGHKDDTRLYPKLPGRKARTLLVSRRRDSGQETPVSDAMRARLGPQEPGKTRPPVATTWGAHPDPLVTPMVQNFFPHQALRQAGRNLSNEPPIGSISKRLDDMLSMPFALILFITTPQGDSSCPNSPRERVFEGIRETVWSGRVQVEAYSMDAVLQIFKRSICPGTPFFELLAKKPPTTMDDLFRRASKYSMLEDEVRAATQQILVAGQASRSGAERNVKLPDQPRPSGRRQEE
ncbi:hypothetical protein CK203_021925 [Vitis vinifera]|uniref:Uncharacterized protein n=1 Tax=Vitis vinifera TaxID=29760 RepID=A0A438JFC9_VITVI|nr:hypothetical protein CK203_021925 [Vitis vinifera]